MSFPPVGGSPANGRAPEVREPTGTVLRSWIAADATYPHHISLEGVNGISPRKFRKKMNKKAGIICNIQKTVVVYTAFVSL